MYKDRCKKERRTRTDVKGGAYKDGRFHDLVMLAILRSEFDELHGGPDREAVEVRV